MEEAARAPVRRLGDAHEARREESRRGELARLPSPCSNCLRTGLNLEEYPEDAPPPAPAPRAKPRATAWQPHCMPFRHYDSDWPRKSPRQPGLGREARKPILAQEHKDATRWSLSLTVRQIYGARSHQSKTAQTVARMADRQRKNTLESHRVLQPLCTACRSECHAAVQVPA